MCKARHYRKQRLFLVNSPVTRILSPDRRQNFDRHPPPHLHLTALWPFFSPSAAFDAMRYVADIRRRFESNPRRYTSFLRNLAAYGRGRMRLRVLFDRQAAVLSGHRDLLEQFVDFLPQARREEFRIRIGFFWWEVGMKSRFRDLRFSAAGSGNGVF